MLPKPKKKTEKSSEEAKDLEEKERDQDNDKKKNVKRTEGPLEEKHRALLEKAYQIFDDFDEYPEWQKEVYDLALKKLPTSKGKTVSCTKRWKVKKIFTKIAQWTKLKKKKRPEKEGTEEKNPNTAPGNEQMVDETPKEGTEERRPDRRPGKEEMVEETPKEEREEKKPNRRPGKEIMRDEKPKSGPRRGTGRDRRNLTIPGRYVHNPPQGLTYYEAPDDNTFRKVNHCGEGVGPGELNTSNDLDCSEKYVTYEGLCAKKVVTREEHEDLNLAEDAVILLAMTGFVGTQILVLKFQMLKKSSEKRASEANVILMKHLMGA